MNVFLKFSISYAEEIMIVLAIFDSFDIRSNLGNTEFFCDEEHN